MANRTNSGVEVLSIGFKRDDNETVLCNDKVELKVSTKGQQNYDSDFFVFDN